MPSNKNTTNKTNRKQVNTSTLTLVEKDDLLDELAKKLKSSIEEVFAEATDLAKDEISGFLKEKIETDVPSKNPSTKKTNPQPTRETIPNPNPSRSFVPPDPEPPVEPKEPRQQKEPKDKSKLTFEQMLRVQVATKELHEKVVAEQRKADKEKRSKYLKENTYSSAGKRHGAQIDEMASEIHKYNKKDLEEAHKKVSDIRESVKVTTLGKEQGVLTDATVKLQEAIQQEIKKRSTTMGKIGAFMDKQNIDAVSIISSLAGHSPIVGLATKYFLDKFRENRDAQAKEKAKKYQVGNLHEKLPRSDEPQIDNDDDVKLDYESASKHVLKHKDEHVRHLVLKDMLKKKQIDEDLHRRLHTEAVSPEYKEPTVVPGQPQPQSASVAAPEMVQPHPQGIPMPPAGTHVAEQQPPVHPTSPTPEPAQRPTQPVATAPKQILRDHLGNAVPDWEGYLKKTTKKKQRDDEAAAWLDMMGKHGKEKMQAEWEKKKKQPVKDWEKDEEIFGPPNSKPTALAHMERREAERVKNKYNSPVKAMMVDAPKPQKSTADPVSETVTHLEKQETERLGNLAQMEKLEAERLKNSTNSPVQPMKNPHIVPKQEKADTFHAMAQAAAPERITKVQLDKNPETELHPDMGPGNSPVLESILSLLKLMEATEKDQDKKLGTLADDKKGPFSKLEKLGDDQLKELQQINKQLATQIDQAELSANAKRRETPDAGGIGGLGEGLLGAEGSKEGKSGGEKPEGLIHSIIKHYIERRIFKSVIGKVLGNKMVQGVLEKGASKFPILKKIPVIKNLFKGAAGEGAAAAGEGAASSIGKTINMEKGADGTFTKAAGEGEGAAAGAGAGAEGATGAAGGASKVASESGGVWNKLLSKVGLGKGAGEGAAEGAGGGAAAGAAGEGVGGLAEGAAAGAEGGLAEQIPVIGKAIVLGLDGWQAYKNIKAGDYRSAAGDAGDAVGTIGGGIAGGVATGAAIGAIGGLGAFDWATIPIGMAIGGIVAYIGGKIGKKTTEAAYDALSPDAKKKADEIAENTKKNLKEEEKKRKHVVATSEAVKTQAASQISTSPTPVHRHAGGGKGAMKPVTIPSSTSPSPVPKAMLTQNPWNQDTSDLDTGHHDIPKGAMGTGGIPKDAFGPGIDTPESTTPTPVSKPESKGGIFGTGIGSGLMSAASSAIGSVGSALSFAGSAGSAIGGFFGVGGGDKGEARSGKPDDSLGGSKSEYARLGSMSAKGESGGDAGITNFDRDGGKYATQKDPGGRSYGLYQITSGNENMRNGIKMKDSTMVSYLQFLEKNHPEIAKQLNAAGGLEGANKGDSAFVKTWKELAKSNPNFVDSQHEFIGKKHMNH